MDANDILPNASDARLISLDMLPVELWSHIFSFITELKDIKNILLTCKLFNQVILRSIKKISTNKRFTVEEIRKFTSLRIITTPIIIIKKLDLEYINMRKFTSIKIIVMTREITIDDILKFIKENEQLNTFVITSENVSYYFSLYYDTLQFEYNIDFHIITWLNELNNPYIKYIRFSRYNDTINNLDKNKYILKIFSLNDKYNFYDCITTAFRIKIMSPTRSERKFINPCQLRHTIYCNYSSYDMKAFETFLKTLKHNFPVANLDNVVYDRTSYLRNYLEPCYRRDKHYNKLLRTNVSNKPYKVI